MNFISFEQLAQCIYQNLEKIPVGVDLIVGIPRSGSLAANLIALYLNRPYIDIDSFLRKDALRSGSTRKCSDWIKTVEDASHILVVDDSISSGKAMQEVKRQIKLCAHVGKVTYMAVYAMRLNCHMVDIYFDTCEQPRMFEWNYMHHWALQYMCMDIDGVLCQDPTIIQNDDGERYRTFLHNAVPKIIPTQKVGKLVTGRLERYRKETQEWLARQGVEYDDLLMIPADTARERRRNYDQADFKAQIYLESDCILFIESSYEQAVEICRIADKPVFCVENRTIIYPDKLWSHVLCLKNDWKITLKRVYKKIFYNNKLF